MNKYISHIYHLADIHIRNLERHDEYEQVFQKLYDSLKKENRNNGLIVIAGDIVHNKVELSPECIDTTSRFIKSLCEIMPVLIIPGNHDGLVNNPHRMGALTPIIENLNINNIYYLPKQTIFETQNIIFGISSVFEDNKIIEINKHITDKNNKKKKICIYHGAVDQALINEKIRLENNKCVVDDFKDYDYVLLGDVHRHQYLNESKTIAYSGSLIQQNHIETVKNHGYIIWDLEAKDSKYIEVQNDFGFITIEINKHGAKFSEKVALKFPRVRVKAIDVTKKEVDILMKLYKTKFNITSYTIEYIYSPGKTINNSINKKQWEEELDNCISYFNKYKIDTTQIKNNMLKHIQDILLNDKTQKQWKIQSLEFDNYFCYGDKNYVDFKKLNSIVGIIAPNGTGKSSVIDILLYTLYEKCSRVSNKNYRYVVLNQDKKYCSSILKIEYEKKLYEIHRSVKKAVSNYTYEVELYVYDGEKRKCLSGSSKNDTNDIIESYFGKYENAIMSFVLLQNDRQNFIQLSQKEKKEYLKKIFKLDDFDLLYKHEKKKYNEFNYEHIAIQKQLQSIIIEDSEKKLNKKINKINIIINELKVKLSKIPNIIPEKIYKKNTINYHALIISLFTENINIQKELKKIKLVNNINFDEEIKNLQKQKHPTGKWILFDLQKEIYKCVCLIKNISIYQKNSNSDQTLEKCKDLNKYIERCEVYHNTYNKINTELKQLEKQKIHIEYNKDCNVCIKNNKDIIERNTKINLSIICLNERKINLENEISKILENSKTKNLEYYIKEQKEKKEQMYNYIEEQHKLRELNTKLINYKEIEENIKKNEYYDKQIEDLQKQKEKQEFIKKQMFKFDSNKLKINDFIQKHKQQVIYQNTYNKYRIDNLEIKQADYIKNKIKLCEEERDKNIKKLIITQEKQKDKDRIQNQYEELDKKKKEQELYSKLLSPDGLPYFILKTIIPSIEQQVNDKLQIVIPNMTIYFEEDDNGIYGILKKNQQNIPIENISGSEQFLLNLILRIILFREQEKTTNFMIIDEGFTSFDQDRMLCVKDIMTYFFTEIDTMIIITHLEILKSFLQNIYTIGTNKDNSSKLFV